MQLSIKVRGELVSTNFDAWKEEWIAQLRSVNTDLATDSDFALAELSVKRFKSAENALKAAKSSTISQAPDIFQLFAAIDQVAEEVRAVRLTLERQIRQRKQEIRSRLIDSSIHRIRAYIERQCPTLHDIDMSDYLDRYSYEEATKRRTTVSTVVAALDDLCSRIERQIDERAILVAQNMGAIDALSSEQQLLFQDRRWLLGLSRAELDHLIEERISKQRETLSSVASSSGQAAEVADLASSNYVEVAGEQEIGADAGAPRASVSSQVRDVEEAARILEALTSGCDPFSGEVLSRDSILTDPRVQRALEIAIRALRSAAQNTFDVHLTEDATGLTLSEVAFFELGIRPSGGPARFLKPGWFYVGPTGADCPKCHRRLKGMRKPYISSGRTYHYWALVCVDCKEAFEPRELSESTRKALYESSQLKPGPTDPAEPYDSQG